MDGKNGKNFNIIMKKNIFSNKVIIKNTDNNNKNAITSFNQKYNQLDLDKDDLIISKKKKNSDNIINKSNNRNKKQLNLEKNFPEKNNNKYSKKIIHS